MRCYGNGGVVSVGFYVYRLKFSILNCIENGFLKVYKKGYTNYTKYTSAENTPLNFFSPTLKGVDQNVKD